MILQGTALETAVHETLVCLLPEERHGLAEDCAEGGTVTVSLTRQGGDFLCRVQAVRGGEERTGECRLPPEGDSPLEQKRVETRAVKTAVYRAVVGFLPQPPVWGAMSGVKPAKPLRQAFPQGIEEEAADAFLKERFFIAPSRRKLAIRCAQKAQQLERSLPEQTGALYIGIPFCPSKCVYCSFVSGSTAQWGHLIPPYLDALCCEVEATGEGFRQNGWKLDSIYMGGGTPTTLTAPQMDRLLTAVQQHLPHPREFTVEAGRPETITGEKLEVLHRHGVGRISINPQSMHDEVLQNVGRLHTVQQIEERYRMARQVGNFEINMDLIAGLPGDDEAGLLESVRRLIDLQPENITIHCLARKKGSPLRFGPQGQLPAETLDAAYAMLEQAGYAPYYLYRQKYIAGNLENVGFAKGDTICRYNILMMEELCPVVALGAGGVTKICADGGRNITRLTNPKYPKEYIEHSDAICKGKQKLELEFDRLSD